MSRKRTGCLGAVIAFIVLLAAFGASGQSHQSAQTDASQSAPQTQPQSQQQTDAGAQGAPEASDEPAPSNPEPAPSGNLVVRFVDVGQGDATVLEFPDGKTMVIDTAADGDAAVNAQLANDARSTVDWLVATHPDADHIGGLPGVIRANSVASVWAPAVSHDTRTYTRFLQSVADAGLRIDTAQAGKQIASGDNYSIDLLWPPAGADYEDTNDYSAIVLVTYGSTKLLFTGDAPVEAEQQANAGHVDVLKVSHHGSASGTDAGLAASLSPSIAVLSYGIGNDYGHPTQVVLDALAGAGAQVYGTGANGTVTVTSDGTNVSASAEREGQVVAASDHAGAGSKSLGAGAGTSASSASSSSSSISSQASQSISGDESAQDTVYVTPKGKKYHQKDCSTIEKSKHLTAMTRSEAEAKGYTACKVCGG